MIGVIVTRSDVSVAENSQSAEIAFGFGNQVFIDTLSLFEQQFLKSDRIACRYMQVLSQAMQL